MIRVTALLSLFLLPVLGACSAGEDEPAAPKTAAEGLQALDTATAEIRGRSEHDAERIDVQHCLIGVGGHPGLPQVTRSRAEAELLTADVWQEVVRGMEFDDLVKQHTDDAHPGIYTMTTIASEVDMANSILMRAQMVPGFGDIGWRLAVGEVGIARYDRDGGTSPFGWHLIKRLR